MNDAPRTLLEATRRFSDPVVCREYMEAQRWPNGIVCPTCGAPVKKFIESEQRWQCGRAHKSRKFTVKTGSVMEDSPLSLEIWLIAMWLIGNAKNGISSWEIHRALGVTQKTAWFLLHRIRFAMDNGGMFTKMTGEVEADETFIGGKAINMHKDKKEARGFMDGGFGKAIVLGFRERNTGRMVTYVVKDRLGKTIKPLVEKTV